MDVVVHGNIENKNASGVGGGHGEATYRTIYDYLSFKKPTSCLYVNS